jgi:two-component system sensor histidine kinase YesM
MDRKKTSQFIHHSLITATQIASIEKAPKTLLLLKQMDEVFQYLTKENKSVSLFDELRTLEKYLQIQKMRYGNRFTINFMNENCFKNIFINQSIVISTLDSILMNSIDRFEGNLNISIEFNNDIINNNFTITLSSDGITENFKQSFI